MNQNIDMNVTNQGGNEESDQNSSITESRKRRGRGSQSRMDRKRYYLISNSSKHHIFGSNENSNVVVGSENRVVDESVNVAMNDELT